MIETGTGWPGESYPLHANTKLSEDQKAYIAASGEPEAQWIREAVDARIAREQLHGRIATRVQLADNIKTGHVKDPS